MILVVGDLRLYRVIFLKRGTTLLESTAIQSYDFLKSIPDTYIAKGFARDIPQVIKKVQESCQKKRLPQAFADVKKPDENLVYKKGQSRRRRANTAREAADQEEHKERRRLRI